ncbi:MAG: hypothetical protein D4R64_10750 [Porphyromonadaceae bacterium]|nr:MAG: hypothetical protein D4R64_10750 [Porphyromonadaceae bacterium]
MKTKMSVLTIAAVALGLAFTGCVKKPLLMDLGGPISIKAANSVSGSKFKTAQGDITLPGGTFQLSEAWVNVANLTIQENSGEEHQDANGNQGGKDTKEKPESGNSGDTGDIVLAGPYLLNIADGSTPVDQMVAPAGTYKKINLDLLAGQDGHTILLKGTLNGNVPVEISSDLAGTFELLLPNGGVVVTASTTVSLTVVFDVQKWFDTVDLVTAQLTNGKILIDPNNNKALYDLFVKNVQKFMEVE